MTVVAKEKIILGVDPGTTVMGYGIIKVSGSRIDLVQYGVIHLSKYSNHALKLSKIFERTVQLIEEFTPDEMAVESPFFGKNIQAMLKLGRAQGVCMAAAISHEVPICEYAPKEIKLSVTGNGNASKEQVAGMLKHLLKFKEAPEFLDATDALGVAICHHFQNGKTKSKSKGWGDFLKNNPGRVK